jgi:hypothetical protein
MSALTRTVYALLETDQPITAAGVCYLLRGMDLAPNYSEAENALEWLCRNGHAVESAPGDFGPEYLKVSGIRGTYTLEDFRRITTDLPGRD